VRDAVDIAQGAGSGLVQDGDGGLCAWRGARLAGAEGMSERAQDARLSDTGLAGDDGVLADTAVTARATRPTANAPTDTKQRGMRYHSCVSRGR